MHSIHEDMYYRNLNRIPYSAQVPQILPASWLPYDFHRTVITLFDFSIQYGITTAKAYFSLGKRSSWQQRYRKTYGFFCYVDCK